jgi:hypothetical protein
MYRPIADVVQCIIDMAKIRGVVLDRMQITRALSDDGDPYPNESQCEKLVAGNPPENMKLLYENLWRVLEPSVMTWKEMAR